MTTKRIKKRVNEDEVDRATERGTARRRLPIVTRLAPHPSDERLDSEESELAGAGLVRLPAESPPDSFWNMPAPRVSFLDAVWAVTSGRDES